MSALHWMKSLNRFANRATAYTKYLPRYLAVAIDQVFAGLEVPTGLTVADIGSVTGIYTRRLAVRGDDIWAIAPNAAVNHPGVTNWQGTVELIGLSSQSVDWMTCFLAFHRVEPETRLVEFHQILNPKGQFALTRNKKDSTAPLTAVYRNLYPPGISKQLGGRFSTALSFDTLGNNPLFRKCRKYSVANTLFSIDKPLT